MTDHPNRFSNVLSYRHRIITQRDGTFEPCTDLMFTHQGEHFGGRVFGALKPWQLGEEEDRFLERRHKRRASLGVVR